MEALGSVASGSTRRIHRSSSVGRVTRRSGCGMFDSGKELKKLEGAGAPLGPWAPDLLLVELEP